jgi:hypothetical protein
MAVTVNLTDALAALGDLSDKAPAVAQASSGAAAAVVRDAARASAASIAYSGNPSTRLPDLHINLVQNGATMADAMYMVKSRDNSTALGDITTYHVSWRKSGKSGLPFTGFGPHVERGRVLFSRPGHDGKKIWIDITKVSNAHPFLFSSLARVKSQAVQAGVDAALEVIAKVKS